MNIKWCSACKTEKSKSEFRKSNTRPDGLQTKCVECDKAYAREYYKRNKERCVARTKRNTEKLIERFQKFKNELKCVVCDEDENCCIDFHHLEEHEKEESIANLIYQKGNWTVLMEEIKKCVPICSNCHRKVHKGIIKLTA